VTRGGNQKNLCYREVPRRIGTVWQRGGGKQLAWSAGKLSRDLPTETSGSNTITWSATGPGRPGLVGSQPAASQPDNSAFRENTAAALDAVGGLGDKRSAVLIPRLNSFDYLDSTLEGRYIVHPVS